MNLVATEYPMLHIKPWEIYGGKRAFFLRYADLIQKTISELKLKPVDQAILAAGNVAGKAATAIDRTIFDPGIYGGRRLAHLHYRGNIYLLSAQQWKTFTEKVKEDMVARLGKANSISVENMIDISESLDPVA